MSALDRLDALLAGMSEKEQAELDKTLSSELARPWLPTPGPQLEAFLSEADLLLYGGAAGGGKTDLLCGLALTEHMRSVIFRRQADDLRGFWDRLSSLCPDPAEQNSNIKRMVTSDGRLIECGHLDKPRSEFGWQGRPHDFIGFDEGAQLTAAKVNFVLGWNRSADGRRCRAVIATNPPIGGEGAWLIEWFAPWLDPMFPNRAEPGELRWAIVVGNGSEIVTVWVDGPEPVIVEDGKVLRLATPEEMAAEKRREDIYEPISRTFIPSKLEDNPYLRDTGYRAKINAMPEPLRSQLLHGDFMAGKVDDPYQVIPTAWVKLAQERWRKNADKPRSPQTGLGVDVAQGGNDKTVYAPLHGVRFEELTEQPGKETPDPPDVVQGIFKARRNDALITVDCGGGYGGGVVSHLKTHHDIHAVKFLGSEADGGRTKDGSLGFYNVRAASWWALREALDPENDENVELPPDQKLEAQLTAPTWELKKNLILVESKDDIRERLGSSTDRADAVIMAWWNRRIAAARRMMKQNDGRPGRAKADDYDPLEDF
jgi:hypothetical protein